MDNTTPIVPTFNGQLGHSAATLCDFFLIMNETLVQVLRFRLTVNGKEYEFPVVPGKHKMALFLLFCAVLRQKTSFLFDDGLRAMLVPYFGTETVTNARFPETSHAALQLLVLRTDVYVSLVLRPGYKLPKNPGRTIRKLIEHGWSRHNSISLWPDLPVPLIRQAVMEFMRANQNGAIRIISSWDPKLWPSKAWEDRVALLYRTLHMRTTDTRATPQRSNTKH